MNNEEILTRVVERLVIFFKVFFKEWFLIWLLMEADEKYNSICIEYPFILRSISLQKTRKQHRICLILFVSLVAAYLVFANFFFKSLLKCSKK